MEIIKIDAKELSLVKDNAMNDQQLKLLLKATPKQYVHTRPAKGGGTWEYVSGGYVRKVLNLMFGWDWDFEIISEQVMGREAVVKGKLTCRIGDRQIVKMQFGNKDIMYRKGTDEPLSLGNDMKAAATDALKKCAAELGIAADIYNKQDFKEINVTSESLDEINDRKERDRLQRFIESATTKEQLDPIRPTAAKLGILEMYQVKYLQL
jgi:recombination DNA repair RAD52 pathway protein